MTLNVSKWVKLPLLIDEHEMKDLLCALPSFQFYQVQKVTNQGEGIVPIPFFLKNYTMYIGELKQGKIPSSHFTPLFSPVLSVSDEALDLMPIDQERQLYKPKLPVVQMQAHAIVYNRIDHSFRSGLFSSDTISWGISLGYPQIYEDPKTHAIFPTRTLLNGILFHEIQKWIRLHTRPTPFIVNGRKQNVPIRLGNTCLNWIHSHPQLKEQSLEIHGATHPSTLH